MNQGRPLGIARPKVWITSVIQLAILALGAVLALLLESTSLVAFLAGGAIEAAGRGYFSFQAFRLAGASRVHAVLASLKRGEAGKFLLGAVMFGFLFYREPDINPVAVFAGYGVFAVLGTLVSARLCK